MCFFQEKIEMSKIQTRSQSKRDDEQGTSKDVEKKSSQFEVKEGQRIYMKEVYELDQYVEFDEVVLMAPERTVAPFFHVATSLDIKRQSEKGRNILEGKMTAMDRLTKINLTFDGQTTDEYLVFAKIQRKTHEDAIKIDFDYLNKEFKNVRENIGENSKQNRIIAYRIMVLNFLSVWLQVKNFQS